MQTMYAVISYFESCAASEQPREIAIFVRHAEPQTRGTSSSLQSSCWVFESWLEWSAERSLLACTGLVSWVSQVGLWFLSQESWEHGKNCMSFQNKTSLSFSLEPLQHSNLVKTHLVYFPPSYPPAYPTPPHPVAAPLSLRLQIHTPKASGKRRLTLLDSKSFLRYKFLDTTCEWMSWLAF